MTYSTRCLGVWEWEVWEVWEECLVWEVLLQKGLAKDKMTSKNMRLRWKSSTRAKQPTSQQLRMSYVVTARGREAKITPNRSNAPRVKAKVQTLHCLRFVQPC